jgi:RecB family exonuclease
MGNGRTAGVAGQVFIKLMHEQGLQQLRLVTVITLQYLICEPTSFTCVILRKSPNSGIASKIRISATPTYVYDRTYIVLHVYNSNVEQPIRFLVAITIKRRLAV